MATSAQHAAPVVRAPLSARFSWMLFDWSVQPFYTLILTFLFGPAGLLLYLVIRWGAPYSAVESDLTVGRVPGKENVE